MQVSIDKFLNFARGLDITVQVHLKIHTGNTYKPCALLRDGQNVISVITNGVIGSKRNDDKGYGPIADASS